MNGPNPSQVKLNRCDHRAFTYTNKKVDIKTVSFREANIGFFQAHVWECCDCKAVELRIYPLQEDAQEELKKTIL